MPHGKPHRNGYGSCTSYDFQIGVEKVRAAGLIAQPGEKTVEVDYIVQEDGILIKKKEAG